MGDESEETVKFPKRLRHRGEGKVLATFYKRPDGYRLYWRARVDGKRRSLMKDFPTYSAAKREADKVLSDLVKGSPVTALSTGHATPALAALERLQAFYQKTGRHVSLLAGINEYCEAAEKLTGHTLAEAVERFINTVAILSAQTAGRDRDGVWRGPEAPV